MIAIVRRLVSDGEDRTRLLKRTLSLSGAVGAAVVIVWGLRTLERNVVVAEESDAPPIIRINAPPELEGPMTTLLDSVADLSWSNPQLCRHIGETLESSGWVKRVDAVQRLEDHSVEVECTYRVPVALVQSGSGCNLVDSDDVRLPGTYACDDAFIIIQGIRSIPPPAGQKWTAPELASGRRLAELLSSEPYANQIVAVRVHNYAGREDSAASHLVLATDRPGGTIYWGSAIDEEIEENSTAEKLELLRANYRQFGRVDAHRPIIDISILPDRIVIPPP